MRLASAIGLLACFALGACDRPKKAPRRTPPDSSTLYGDPALMPTPEGEAARRDLASAGDLRKLLPLEDAEVVIARPSPGELRVIVRGRLLPEADEATVATTIESTARAALGESAQVELLLETARERGPERPRTDPLLWLAFIGLGASLGVVAERSRRR